MSVKRGETPGAAPDANGKSDRDDEERTPSMVPAREARDDEPGRAIRSTVKEKRFGEGNGDHGWDGGWGQGGSDAVSRRPSDESVLEPEPGPDTQTTASRVELPAEERSGGLRRTTNDRDPPDRAVAGSSNTGAQRPHEGAAEPGRSRPMSAMQGAAAAGQAIKPAAMTGPSKQASDQQGRDGAQESIEAEGQDHSEAQAGAGKRSNPQRRPAPAIRPAATDVKVPPNESHAGVPSNEGSPAGATEGEPAEAGRSSGAASPASSDPQGTASVAAVAAPGGRAEAPAHADAPTYPAHADAPAYPADPHRSSRTEVPTPDHPQRTVDDGPAATFAGRADQPARAGNPTGLTETGRASGAEVPASHDREGPAETPRAAPLREADVPALEDAPVEPAEPDRGSGVEATMPPHPQGAAGDGPVATPAEGSDEAALTDVPSEPAGTPTTAGIEVFEPYRSQSAVHEQSFATRGQESDAPAGSAGEADELHASLQEEPPKPWRSGRATSDRSAASIAVEEDEAARTGISIEADERSSTPSAPQPSRPAPEASDPGSVALAEENGPAPSGSSGKAIEPPLTEPEGYGVPASPAADELVDAENFAEAWMSATDVGAHGRQHDPREVGEADWSDQTGVGGIGSASGADHAPPEGVTVRARGVGVPVGDAYAEVEFVADTMRRTDARPSLEGARPAAEDDRPIIAPSGSTPASASAAEPGPAIANAAQATQSRKDRTGRRSGRGRSERPEANAAPVRNRRSQRIERGGTVMIDGDLYRLLDWSTGGVAVGSEEQTYRIGDVRTLELELDLTDYAVNIDLEARVANRTAERTGWQFTGPNETQRQVLRALTHASLHTRGFEPHRSQRLALGAPSFEAPEARRRGVIRPLAAAASLPFNAAVIVVLALFAGGTISSGGLSFAGGSGAASGDALRAEHAAVAVERIVMSALGEGIVLDWGTAPGEPIDAGAPLVAVLSGSGSEADRSLIASPCDCFLARILKEEGSTVSRGEPMALLYERDTTGHIQALFAEDVVPRPGDRVAVKLPYSGTQYDGVVEEVGALDDPQSTIGLPMTLLRQKPAAVFVRISTEPALPATAAGDPAIVTLRGREPT